MNIFATQIITIWDIVVTGCVFVVFRRVNRIELRLIESIALSILSLQSRNCFLYVMFN